jgi:hypothetical protein
MPLPRLALPPSCQASRRRCAATAALLPLPCCRAAQPLTPMQTDNATAHALLNIKILPKALKAMNMHLHWLRCCNAQEQFRYYWRPGTQNLADYFTKHHLATHHKSVCPTIPTPVNDPEYRKLFQNTEDSTKLEGTNNYAGNKNFQKLPKIADTKGTNNYEQKKTSENLQNITELEGTKNPPPNKNSRYRQKIAELEGTINTPPSKNAQYCQRIAELEGTKNTPPSKNSRYRPKNAKLEGTKLPSQAKICNIGKKLLSWRVTTNFQKMITAKSA